MDFHERQFCLVAGPMQRRSRSHVDFPASSPHVLAVGGTRVTAAANNTIETETVWNDGAQGGATGGGYSTYETRPAFQTGISSVVGTKRGVPDVAAVGNPRTGVWVYNSYENTAGGALYAWNIIGGTSVASPLWAGIVNHAGHFSASVLIEETLIYASAKTAADFRDVTIGSCGFYEGWSAAAGWDPCSGNGTPLGTAGK